VPGRRTGSYVIGPRESVTLALILRWMVCAESVNRIREDPSGVDFDILEVGSLRDRIRQDGAWRKMLIFWKTLET
jgi:hypothetical protein